MLPNQFSYLLGDWKIFDLGRRSLDREQRSPLFSEQRFETYGFFLSNLPYVYVCILGDSSDSFPDPFAKFLEFGMFSQFPLGGLNPFFEVLSGSQASFLVHRASTLDKHPGRIFISRLVHDCNIPAFTLLLCNVESTEKK